MAITVTLVPADQPPPPGRHLLARIRCRRQLPPWAELCSADTGQALTLPLQQVTGDDCDELWLVDEPVESLQRGPVQCRQTRTHRFCWLWFNPDNAEFGGVAKAAAETGDDPIYRATHWAYTQLLQSLRGTHSHLLKIWHYLPGINLGEGDEERYRRFCRGREQALHTAECPFTPLPAATAIGIPDRTAPALFYWLSTSEPGVNIENPRQTHAWRYPRQFGPASPNFSRGTLSKVSRQFLISGTASVVGHHTAHPHDTPAQTREMLTNLEALIATARRHCTHLPRLGNLSGPLRVYLRDPQDWPQVQATFSQAGLPMDQVIPCHGDICRSDLMVEVDGLQPVSPA